MLFKLVATAALVVSTLAGVPLASVSIQAKAESHPPEQTTICGKTTIMCYRNTGPSRDETDDLIEQLEWRDVKILGQAKYICQTQSSDDKQACVSWDRPLSNVKFKELKQYVELIDKKCNPRWLKGSGKLKSGKMEGALLNGVCTSVCLSDRPGGCDREGGAKLAFLTPKGRHE